MVDRFSYPDPDPYTAFQEVNGGPVTISQGVLWSRRSVPPADFVVRIECFSSLSSDLGVDSYESGIFEAGDYKWRLSIYPDGDKKRGGDGYVSVYLVLVDTNNSFPVGWQIKVNFKLFIYDQIRDEYTTVEGLNRRFHKMNTQHGFPKLMSLRSLCHESNGYLINDTCIFGAEIFVLQNQYKRRHQCLALQKKPDSLQYILWKLENFSKLNNECYQSDILSLGEKKWKFIIYPRGDRLNKGKLSVHLQMVEPKAYFGFGFDFMRMVRRDKHESNAGGFSLHDDGFLVNFVFQLVDLQNSRHSLFRIVTRKFEVNWTTSNPTIKCGDMILLSDLMENAESFLVNDELHVSAQIHVFCEVKNN